MRILSSLAMTPYRQRKNLNSKGWESISKNIVRAFRRYIITYSKATQKEP